MTDEEMVAALRKHADFVAGTDDPDTATALRWAADRIADLSKEPQATWLVVKEGVITEARVKAATKVFLESVGCWMAYHCRDFGECGCAGLARSMLMAGLD